METIRREVQASILGRNLPEEFGPLKNKLLHKILKNWRLIPVDSGVVAEESQY
jgi:hypothetical protein